MNRFFGKHFNSIVLSFFFLSGFTGLCYEICWIRLSSRIFGSTTFAVSSVVALFFTGMALGSRYFGNRSGRYRKPLKVYALLEIGIGLIAVASPYLLSLFEIPYQWLYPSYYQDIVVISAIRLLLIAVVIIPLTFLMSGTLPLLAIFYEASDRAKNDGVAFLYALNTLGAAVGCLLCGFLMLPLLGIGKTLLAIGFLALITHNTVYTYTISLAVALVGIAAGSYLARFRERADSPVALLGFV
jgi:spermidine synthase